LNEVVFLRGSQDCREDGKEKGRTSEKPDRPLLSAFLNEVRTFFEQKFCLQAEFLIKV
jgi:hypothetical protein